MKYYVLIHVQPEKYFQYDIPILLIEKKNPAWQAGKKNISGGKVEENETPRDAAIREFVEEYGGQFNVLDQMGKIIGDWGEIYCFKATIPSPSDNFYLCTESIREFFPPNPRPEEVEEVFWENWHAVKDDKDLMPNLRVLIPLMICDVKDWAIIDNGETWGNMRHLIGVEITGTDAVVNNSLEQW